MVHRFWYSSSWSGMSLDRHGDIASPPSVNYGNALSCRSGRWSPPLPPGVLLKAGPHVVLALFPVFRVLVCERFQSRKPGNHPNFERKRSRSEKAILGATLGIPGHSRSNSRNGTHNLIYVKTLLSEQLSERLDAKISAQILGALFSKLVWFPRARQSEQRLQWQHLSRTWRDASARRTKCFSKLKAPQ